MSVLIGVLAAWAALVIVGLIVGRLRARREARHVESSHIHLVNPKVDPSTGWATIGIVHAITGDGAMLSARMEYRWSPDDGHRLRLRDVEEVRP